MKAEKLRREREQTHHDGSPDDHLSHSRVTTDLSSHSNVAADQLNQRPAHSDHRSRSAHKDRSLLRTYSKSPRTLDDISTSYKDDFTAASSTSAPALSAEGASRTAPSQSHRKMTHHRYVFIIIWACLTSLDVSFTSQETCIQHTKRVLLGRLPLLDLCLSSF